MPVVSMLGQLDDMMILPQNHGNESRQMQSKGNKKVETIINNLLTNRWDVILGVYVGKYEWVTSDQPSEELWYSHIVLRD